MKCYEAHCPSSDFLCLSSVLIEFYLSSQVGDKVNKGQVVCIIEAMKLMNEIEVSISLCIYFYNAISTLFFLLAIVAINKLITLSFWQILPKKSTTLLFSFVQESLQRLGI